MDSQPFNKIIKNRILFKYISSCICNHDRSSLKWNQLTQSTRELIYYGYVDELDQLLSHYNLMKFIGIFEGFIKPHLHHAVRHYHMVEYLNLKFNHNDWDDNILVYAANSYKQPQQQSLKVFKYLYENRFYWLNSKSEKNSCELSIRHSLKSAASTGHMELFEYIWVEQKYGQLFKSEVSHFKQIVIDSLKAAALHGHIGVVSFIINNFTFNVDSDNKTIVYILEILSTNNNLDIFRLVLNRYYKEVPVDCTKLTLENLVKYGDLNLLKDLLVVNNNSNSSNDNNKYIDLIDKASYYNQLEIIEWLKENKVTIYNKAVDYACERGNIEILKYFINNHKETLATGSDSTFIYSKKAFDLAALNGHLDVIKLLYENGYRKVSTKTMESAVIHGNLSVFKYLFYETTIKTPNTAMEIASLYGHIDIIRFLENECGSTGNIWQSLLNASKNGHLEVFRYIFETNQHTFKSTTSNSQIASLLHPVVCTPNYDILFYLIKEKNIPLKLDQIYLIKMITANLYDNLRLMSDEIKVLCLNNTPNIRHSIEIASKHGQLKILQLLIGLLVIGNNNNDQLTRKIKWDSNAMKVITQALVGGHFHIIEYLLNIGDMDQKHYNYSDFLPNIINTVLNNGGSVDLQRIITILMEYKATLDARDCNAEIPIASYRKTGLPCLIILYNYKLIPPTFKYLDSAILKNDTLLIGKLQDMGLNSYSSSILESAQKSINPHMFEVIFRTCEKFDGNSNFNYNSIVMTSCRNGTLSQLQLIYDHIDEVIKQQQLLNQIRPYISKRVFSVTATELACSLGHLNIVKFFDSIEQDFLNKYQNNNNLESLFSSNCFDLAKRYGRSSVVEWLQEHRKEGNST